MNNIYTIFKKEMARFFKDKRMVVSVVILPGLMIFFMYSLIGGFIGKEIKEANEHKSKVYVKELPKSLEPILTSLNIETFRVEGESYEKERKEIKEKEAELLIIFPQEFDKEVENYEVKSGAKAPEIEIYFNSSRNESGMAYQTIREILNQYEEGISNKFDVNKGEEEKYDLASKEDITGKLFGSMLPMLLMIFMWSGCLAIAPESISGEKERGTIATLLITPTKRSHIALGKIMALSVIALLSGVSSFVGTFTSLPKLFQGMDEGVSAMNYGAKDIFMLFAIILSTVVLLVAIISIVSAFAKSVKEATTIASPIMIVIMVISFLPNFLGGEGEPALWMYAVPLYNSILSMNDIFKFSSQSIPVLLTAGTNLIATMAFVMLLTKMFHSERIMLSK